MIKSRDILYPPRSLGKNIHACMFTKEFFKGKNIHVKDKQDNLKLISTHLGISLIQLAQVHGIKIKEVVERGNEIIPNTDGVYTRTSNIALCIQTADCMPIILSSQNGKEISALHVGWRGLSKGILEESFKYFQSPLETISAWIAPSISREKYEVGEDVLEIFLENDKESEINLIKKNNSSKWLLDLRLEAKRRMQKFGITVFLDNYCTFGDKELFFSFRRNQSPRRMVTVVWRKNG
tara:strand:- start:986 stop:1696 length:711 start_codon:yes stop_codon:yes gene_type:complete